MLTEHLHPLSTHFPIAIILVGFLFDVASLLFKKEPCLSKTGFWLMILGTLAAVVTFFTGEYFSKELTGPAGELKETHEIFAKTTMYVMIGASLIRIWAVWSKRDKGFIKWLVFLLYLGGAGLVSYTGFLGGSIVYDKMLNASEPVTADTTAYVKTIDHLKSAITGETTASAKYNAFAEKAREEKLPKIAALFAAASAAESVHAREHTIALTNLGASMDPVTPVFEVKSTKENLQAALNGETEEFTNMYPAYISDAEKENAQQAVTSMEFAMEVEKVHAQLYSAAIKALEENKTNTLPESYSVCPKCGMTYETVKLPANCELCGTPKDKFSSYK